MVSYSTKTTWLKNFNLSFLKGALSFFRNRLSAWDLDSPNSRHSWDFHRSETWYLPDGKRTYSSKYWVTADDSRVSSRSHRRSRSWSVSLNFAGVTVRTSPVKESSLAVGLIFKLSTDSKAGSSVLTWSTQEALLQAPTPSKISILVFLPNPGQPVVSLWYLVTGKTSIVHDWMVSWVIPKPLDIRPGLPRWHVILWG